MMEPDTLRLPVVNSFTSATMASAYMVPEMTTSPPKVTTPSAPPLVPRFGLPPLLPDTYIQVSLPIAESVTKVVVGTPLESSAPVETTSRRASVGWCVDGPEPDPTSMLAST